MRIKYIEKNILYAKCDVLVNQVNCFGIANHGLAVQMRTMFPNVYEEYKRLCDCKNLTRRDLFGLCQTVKIKNDERFVANLFSQYRPGNADKRNTSYDALDVSLHRLVNWCQNRNVHSIAMPYKMGCTDEHGDWAIVLTIISQAFKKMDVDIILCKPAQLITIT